MDISSKLKEKESVLRFKNGSPKLKDVLRKKCKERLQKNRNDFIDKLRNLEQDGEVKSELTNMMKEDLKTVYTNKNNNISNAEEISEDELEWLMNKYDTIFNDEEYLIELYESLNEVFCPICQKNVLTQTVQAQDIFVSCCHCNFSILSQCDLLQIKENIMSRLDEHNDTCNALPQFSLIKETGECHIYLICHTCFSLVMII